MSLRVFRIVFLLTICSSQIQAQYIAFRITDAKSGEVIKAATVFSKHTKTSYNVKEGQDEIVLIEVPGERFFTISAYGYATKTVSYEVPAAQELSILVKLDPISLPKLLKQSVASFSSLEEKPIDEATAPVDVLTRDSILHSPYTELSQILNYLLVSFNSNRQIIADGTDHIDPSSLRGLGPDQILILVNGKRRHSSALVNINNTVGRGSVSTDLNIIPLHLIEQIEILRGDAAAQYGSDAIAGVINIKFREGKDIKEKFWLEGSYQKGGYDTQADVSFQTSGPKQPIRDGLTDMLNLGVGYKIGSKGFLTLGLLYENRGSTNRSGVDTRPLLYSNEPVRATNETEVSYMARFRVLQQKDSADAARNGLDRHNIRAGIAQIKTISVMVNGGFSIWGGNSLYITGGFSQKAGDGAGFYRLPRQTAQSNLDLFPNGYLPEISSSIRDVSGTIGVKRAKLGWQYDVSNTTGSNQFGFTVLNSTNASIPGDKQTTFDAGKLQFFQNTTNGSVIRYPKSIPNLILALGGEFRLEHYSIQAGEEKSWSNGFPNKPAYTGDKIPGVQVFPGFKPSNEVAQGRSSFAIYGGINYEFANNRMLVEGIYRYEKYSDFGHKPSYKVAARYKLLNKNFQGQVGLSSLTIRGNISAGFRAPSLHQRFFNNESTQNVGGELRQVQTINYNNPIIGLLGQGDFGLRAETSQNYSIGLIGVGNAQKLIFSVDCYWTKVDNRIVFSGQFSTTDSTIKSIINDPSISSLQFFTNAINTESRGIEAQVCNKISEKFGFKATWNLNQTRVNLLESSTRLFSDVRLRNLLFDRQERARFESFNPMTKLILGINYTPWKPLRLNWQAVRFGKVTYLEPGSYDSIFGQGQSDQQFSARWVQDVSCLIKWGHLELSVGVNNLFDVYPDKQIINPRNNVNNLSSDPSMSYTGALDNTSNGRIVYSRTVTQFGANGRFFYVKVRVF